MDDIQSIHLSGSEVLEAEPAVGLLGLIGLGDEVVFHVKRERKKKISLFHDFHASKVETENCATVLLQWGKLKRTEIFPFLVSERELSVQTIFCLWRNA